MSRASLRLCAAPLLVAVFALLVAPASALDNGLRLPPMGWSTWYGFTQNINETMIREIGDGMVSSGLHATGYEHVWLDDGWAVGREGCAFSGGRAGNYTCSAGATKKPRVEKTLFPSGMR